MDLENQTKQKKAKDKGSHVTGDANQYCPGKRYEMWGRCGLPAEGKVTAWVSVDLLCVLGS